jgi:hypothetical protein
MTHHELQYGSHINTYASEVFLVHVCCCVCSAIFYLFKTAPDSISIRRELLSATRYMLSGPYKGVCFQQVIPDVLQEGVLLGSHLASMETLRPLAVRGRGWGSNGRGGSASGTQACGWLVRTAPVVVATTSLAWRRGNWQ